MKNFSLLFFIICLISCRNEHLKIAQYDELIHYRIDNLEDLLDTDPDCIKFTDDTKVQMRQEITYLAFELCERERNLKGETVDEYYNKEEEDGTAIVSNEQ